MTKFSGTKRRPLRTNLTAPIATTNERTRTFEGGDGVRARRRSRSCSCSP